MLQGKGKFYKTDNKLYIYVPVVVATDSAFPFRGESGHVKVKIEGDRLVIEKIPEGKG
ncbi:MAG: hypothetical protein JSV18_01520 [Candidatus Bathyarchaeota archaeon]|nr:MAG: hypothetical protein JSV18_01520 [Candidatus Bathyarchaeota archaeon]